MNEAKNGKKNHWIWWSVSEPHKDKFWAARNLNLLLLTCFLGEVPTVVGMRPDFN